MVFTLRFCSVILLLILLTGCAAYVDGQYLRHDSLHHSGKLSTTQDIWLPVRGGLLHGWYTPAQASSSARGTVIHFHGNGRNLTHHSLYSRWFAGEGFNVFIFDYRGYGKSHGVASLAGMVEDGVSVLRYIEQQAPDGRLVVFGQSLGATMAILALSRYQPAQLGAVILDCPVSSLRQIGVEQLMKMGYPFPLYFFPLLVVPEEYNALKSVAGLAPTPLLIVHGLSDAVVLPRHGKALYQAAEKPKRLILLAGVGHVDSFSYSLDQIKAEVLEFISLSLESSRARGWKSVK